MICRFCNAMFEDDPPCGGCEGCLACETADPHELEREMRNASAREIEMSEQLFGKRPLRAIQTRGA